MAATHNAINGVKLRRKNESIVLICFWRRPAADQFKFTSFSHKFLLLCFKSFFASSNRLWFVANQLRRVLVPAENRFFFLLSSTKCTIQDVNKQKTSINLYFSDDKWNVLHFYVSLPGLSIQSQIVTERLKYEQFSKTVSQFVINICIDSRITYVHLVRLIIHLA